MFVPTRDAGLAALADFVPRAGTAYARDRNHDHRPGRENVSSLSPYLRHRLVTEREVVDAVLERHSLHASEKFVQEVFWRTYWKGWLEQNPEVWRRYRRDVGRLRLDGQTETPEYRAATTARTGIDAMDAWTRELVDTGYLHNHTRMWFASIWIFTLRLPWQLGADFFYRHLIDGDAASNTLSWRWVAGLQTAGKTYLATRENIARYTDGRFAPEGLAPVAHAITEEPLPPRAPLPERDPLPTGARIGLLVHEEDLDAASALPPELAGRVVAVAGHAAPHDRSPFGAAEPVVTFTESALNDGVARAAAAVNGVGELLARSDAATVLAWAGSERLDAVLTPYAPVGPVQERLATLRPAFETAGIGFATVRRAWDENAWPHATRGFFPFRERIPQLVRL